MLHKVVVEGSVTSLHELLQKDPIITERERMEQMLYEAAAQGSVTSLYELLLKDPLIIDRVMLNYTETPLHIAALLGHADFAKEILLQKPELAAELDYRRSSPLHLAAAKGYIEIVKELLFVNPEMCLACDRDGRNPVHLAAMRGHVHVLKELVQAKPHATWAALPRGETILHLCVKHNQLEALKLLVETADAHEIMSAKDDNGFTILHLAVADKQLETINYLLSSTSIEVNAVNLNGCTASDILAQSRRDVQDMEISELLRHVGAAKAKNISFSAYEFGSSRTRGMSSDADDQNRVPCPIGKNCNEFNKKKDDWLDKQQSALMVVASLIATMAFQAGVSPPGDVWGDNSTYFFPCHQHHQFPCISQHHSIAHKRVAHQP
eukprot:XP_019074786.1 PREDICTED: ankyrin-3-like isoform X4 [Vitis vinifera]